MKAWRLVYNLLFPVVLVVMLPSFLIRMVRRGNYRHKFGQRFGIYSKRVSGKLAGHRWTWVHAVSVGEVMIALKLIAGMRGRDPDLRVVLSTTTSTGYRLAARHKSPHLEPIYHPLDIPWAASRAFQTIRPERLILVEAEVWPNCMARAAKAGIPRVLVNARLSPRSEKRYRAVRWLAGPLFNELDALCAQEPGDIPRWESIGVNPARIKLTGSVKFDTDGAPPGNARDFRPVLENLGVGPSDPVLVAGSTFEPEELMLAEIARTLRARFPGLFLILVPRHAERGAGVLAKLERRGFPAALRTAATPPGNKPEILVVNTTGELRDWYACATVVYVGKSMATAARGGQNPAEPITAGKPLVFGPHMQNFSTLARQIVERNAAVQARDPRELEEAFEALLASPERREAMAASARECLDVHRGALARTLDVIGTVR
jgi:3-deoxy-D-manno-octulosonic-acid transferase